MYIRCFSIGGIWYYSNINTCDSEIIYNNDATECVINTSEDNVILKENMQEISEVEFNTFKEMYPPIEATRVVVIPKYSLEEELLITKLALAEAIEKQEIDKLNNQLALAELTELLIMKGVL